MTFERAKIFLATALLMGLAACAVPEPGEVYDPFEPVNRSIHQLNKGLDKAVLSPSATVYGTVLPREVRGGLASAADNLQLPGMVVNDILQFKLQDAVANTLRFGLNSTVGLAGLWDPATKLGIEERPTDFGETLHVWGFPEGPYLELPVLGPSNTRDTAGLIVDFAFNPVLNWVPAADAWILTVAEVTSLVNDRYTYGSTVDSVLHESEDSYVQSRLLFSDNRRFELGGSQAEEDDLYDLYGEAFE
jgi:phospholipid-binding lipoprotein MlaA